MPADVVMIDTAAGLTPEIVRYTEEADTVLLVTGPEPTAVMDAYALVEGHQPGWDGAAGECGGELRADAA